MKNFFEAVINWWKYSARYYHYDLYYGIRNLILWFPVIFKDRDYDHSYILRMLQFKLKRTMLTFKNNLNHEFAHVGMESDIRYMKICIKLIDYILDEHYETKASEELEKKWGEIHFNWYETDGDKTKLNITYDNIHTEFDKRQNVEDSFKLFYEAHSKHDKANRLLYLILQNRLSGWWI